MDSYLTLSLANWDVIGLEEDNILVDEKGQVYRIDNGGSLRYRVQGEPKGDKWTKEVYEIKTMRDPDVNSHTANIFGSVTDEEIEKQTNDIYKRKKEILNLIDDPETYSLVAARIDWLKEHWGSDA